MFSLLQYAREVLDEAAKAIAVGVTSEEIDVIVHEVSGSPSHQCKLQTDNQSIMNN